MALGEYLGAGSGTTLSLFHLNGNSTDSSGNGNNGTDGAGVSYAAGKFGQCAVFNDAVTTSKITGTAPAVTGNFSLSVWLKRNGTNSANGGIIDFGTYGSTGFGIWIYDGTGGHTDGEMSRRINGDYNNFANVGYVLPNLTWTMITVVYNGSNVSWYVNGSLYGTPHAYTTNPASSTTYIFGMRKDTNVGYKGSMDEVIMENVARDAAKVKKHYSMTKGRFGIL